MKDQLKTVCHTAHPFACMIPEEMCSKQLIGGRSVMSLTEGGPVIKMSSCKYFSIIYKSQGKVSN